MSTPSFKDLVIPSIRAIDKWADFTDAVVDTFSLNIEDPTTQIEQIRFLLNTQGNEELQKTAKLLGFNLVADVLELSTSNLSKLVTQLTLYYNASGTELFVKFIDLVMNAKTEVAELYTTDYITFVKSPTGPLVKDGGIWYKTTHIELAISLLSSYPILLYGTTLTSRLKRLFYYNAPINLVINSFWYVVDVSAEVGVGTITRNTANLKNTPIEFGKHTIKVSRTKLESNLLHNSWVKATEILNIESK